MLGVPLDQVGELVEEGGSFTRDRVATPGGVEGGPDIKSNSINMPCSEARFNTHRAADTAASTSASLAEETCSNSSPVAGLMTANVSPSTESTHSLLMKHCVGVVALLPTCQPGFRRLRVGLRRVVEGGGFYSRTTFEEGDTGRHAVWICAVVVIEYRRGSGGREREPSERGRPQPDSGAARVDALRWLDVCR